MNRGLQPAFGAALFILGLAGCQPAQVQSPEPSAKAQEVASTDSVDLLGKSLYEERCAACHEKPEDERTPTVAALKTTSAPQIRFALTSGKMKAQAEGLTEAEINALVGYLSNGDGGVYEVPASAKCSNSSISFAETPVTHWGGNEGGARYYNTDATSLNLATVSQGMELAWAFGFPDATTARSAPVVTDDTLFVLANSGHAFALDRETGCVKWHKNFGLNFRGGLALGKAKGKDAIFFVDAATSAHALDAKTGEVLWKTVTALSNFNMVTAAPAYADGKLFVSLSAIDVFSAMDPKYECCKGHGGVVALNADSGERIWAAHMTEDAQPTTTSSVGTQLYGPSGAPVWSVPAIDLARGRIYIGTGENTSAPATDTSDAMIALDIKTGEKIWVFQALPEDTFNMACSPLRGSGPNCPTPAGPDHDFGGGLSMSKLSDGTDVVVGGQKSGEVHVVNAETGELIWTKKIASGSALGGIHWGLTVANGVVFAPSSDPAFPIPGYQAKPGLTALDLATGEVLWHHAAERGCEASLADRNNADSPWPECSFAFGYSAAPASTDDFVTLGALDGQLFVFDAKTGEVAWAYSTKQPYQTLNGVAAHGGAIDSVAPVLVDDMMYVQSGYAVFSQMPGNVLLAFRAKSQSKE